MTDTNIITRKQLAENLQISTRKVQRLELQGLPSIRLGNNTIRYDYLKVLQWLDRKVKELKA